MAQLQVELVAADREVWSGQASIIIARTPDGDAGIMSGHQPVLSVLSPAPVTIRTPEGATVTAAVFGGFLSVADDRVSILAEVAELADEIDVPAAELALAEARSEHDEAGEQQAMIRLRAAGRM